MALETESGDQSRENNKAKEVSAFDKLVNNSTDDSVATDALLPSPTGPAPKRVPKKKVARAASLPQFKVSKVIVMISWHEIGRMARKSNEGKRFKRSVIQLALLIN